MIFRSILLSALVLYGIVVGCTVFDSTDRAAPASTTRVAGSTRTGEPASRPVGAGLPYRSVGIQLHRLDWIDKYKQSIDEIADLGADTVKIVVDSRQENGKSTRIFLDLRMTPTVEQLSEVIRHAKKRGLRVILMPVVLLDNPIGNEWRGSIQPTLWEEWFESYRSMITHFAYIANDTGVDVLVVGSELVTTENKREEWIKTIKAVRVSYKGLLTYSSNWDHYTAVTFWEQLDLIGMNSYWKFGDKLANPDPSVDQIVARWTEIKKDLIPFVQKTNRPLLFLEIGWFSQSNVAYEPWDYTKDYEPLDVELQRKLFEGFFRSWHGDPHLGGFSVWEWSPGDGGPKDKGYTPEKKPAEGVLREWLGKPAWQVE